MLNPEAQKDATKKYESKEGSESDGDKTQRPRLRQGEKQYLPRDKAGDEVSSTDLDSEAEYSSPPNSPKSRLPSESPSAKTTLHVPEFTDQLKLKPKRTRHRARTTTGVFGTKPETTEPDIESQTLIKSILEAYQAGKLVQKELSASDDSNGAVHGKPSQSHSVSQLTQPSRRGMKPPPPPLSSVTSSEAPLSSLSPVAFRRQNNTQLLSIPASNLPPTRSLSEGARGIAEGSHR